MGKRQIKERVDGGYKGIKACLVHGDMVRDMQELRGKIRIADPNCAKIKKRVVVNSRN